MDVSEFWDIVETANDKAMVEKLLRLPPQDIIEFESLLREKIIESNNYSIMAALKIISGSVSDDAYLYFRCWLIGKGRKAFEHVLQNADSIVDVLQDGEEPENEALLYIATKAYEMKTGKKEDSSFPRSVCISRGLDYDFSAPPTKGTDFTDEQLPTISPKLWKRFRPRGGGRTPPTP